MNNPATTNTGITFGSLNPASTPSTGFTFGASAVSTTAAPTFGTGLNTTGGGLTFGGGGLGSFGDAAKPPVVSFGVKPSATSSGGTTAFGTTSKFGAVADSTSAAPLGTTNFSTPGTVSTFPIISTPSTLAGASPTIQGTATSSGGATPFAPISRDFPQYRKSPMMSIPQMTPVSGSTPQETINVSTATPATSIPADAFTLKTSTSTAILPPASLASSAAATFSVAPTTSTAPTSSAAPTFSLGSSSVAAVPAVTSTAQSATPSKDGVSFSHLEETINKWTIELEEQEKVFLNQMEQVRDWDKMLMSTGDKIVSLNDGMQKVKMRQVQLDHELDFIVAQQRELEECLVPLEKEFADITISDPERNSIYERAENLNTQLQQIAGQLKTVIEHVNEKNANEDTTDPIVQIGKILNAHMNSLQWIDQNTAVIQQMLDQIGKMRDLHGREVDSTHNM